MNNVYRNRVVGLIVIAGIVSFILGQFFIATFMFATAIIYGNIVTRVKVNS
ncbi:MAG: hypothetical protein NTY69_11505 [Methylococcales bacterium]|nr:hypothetical protein [Methylococcales bacterium]